MKQSRLMSLAETVANVAIGYGVAIATQIAVFPLFGIEAALGEHLAIGLVFVWVSLARGYVLRRLFERIRARSTLTASDTENAMRSSTAGVRADIFRALWVRVHEHTCSLRASPKTESARNSSRSSP